MRRDVDRTVEAGQTVVDQVRTLVKSSRGVERMQIMYTDPYARLQELLDDFCVQSFGQRFLERTKFLDCVLS